MAYEAGAFPGSPVGGGMNGIFAPYNIPNVLVDGYDVVLNKPKTAAYRAPGTPAGEFPGDAVINELADMIGHGPDGHSPQERRQGRRRPTLGRQLGPHRRRRVPWKR